LTHKSQEMKYKPTIKDIMLLPICGASISNPQGTKVAFCIVNYNFRDNRRESNCHVYDRNQNRSFQLTHSGYASAIRWIGNETLALMSTKPHDAAAGFQIYLFENLVGEGIQVTNHPGGIESYEPFGNGSPKRDFEKKKQKNFAEFLDIEEEISLSALYYLDYKKLKEYRQKNIWFAENEQIKLLEPIIEVSELLQKPLKVESVLPSKNDNICYINCCVKDDLVFSNQTYCYKIALDLEKIADHFSYPEERELSAINSDTANTPALEKENLTDFGTIQRLNLPPGARIVALSPDESKLLIKYRERDLKPWTQTDLWVLDLSKVKGQLDAPNLQDQLFCLTRDFDREPMQAYWTHLGIFVGYWEESQARIARISEDGRINEIETRDLSYHWDFHVNANGLLSFPGCTPSTIDEIYLGIPKNDGWTFSKITNQNDIVRNWDFGTIESVKWKSKDGTEIEGILRKPSDFNPKKKYPLLIQIHGGPAWVSPKFLLEDMDIITYPAIQFVNKNVLILKPNYRGSIGKGQAFMELNVDNLGIGDMWDVESGIDYLAAQGFIDETRIGACGWSQGGYIGSFLAMHSTRFRAVSAGAALCSWYVYYCGSDTRDSINLTGKAFEGGMKEAYEKTAPISGIETAETPILFQHGENDARVPLISAMEMFRRLKDKNVETKLIVYPNNGHGVNGIRERYALMLQNFSWFQKHLSLE
jgi:dipeptidyl aminopeptidase/acylaminoacyl peptidase